MHFSKRYRYRFGDIDDAGIAYYPALLHYFHCCMEDWWADGIGVPYPTVMREERFGLPAVRIEADFFAPIRYGDDPVISVGVLGTGTSSVELGFWMELASTGTLACRARITTVAVDMDSMHKQPLPERWRRQLERFSLEEGEFPAGRR